MHWQRNRKSPVLKKKKNTEELIFRFVLFMFCKMWIVNVMFAVQRLLIHSYHRSAVNCLHTWGQIMHSSVFFLGNQAVVIFFIKNFHNPGKANIWCGGGGFTVHRSNLCCVLFCLSLNFINCTRKFFFRWTRIYLSSQVEDEQGQQLVVVNPAFSGKQQVGIHHDVFLSNIL